MAIECRPLGRSKGLIVEPLGDELLVYDQERHVAHSLQDVAARVWRACDGTRDASEISEFTGVAVDAVAVALQELFELDLIRGYTPSAQREVSRRTVLRRAATVGAGVGFAGTMIRSIAAPTAALASSTTCPPGGGGGGQPCATIYLDAGCTMEFLDNCVSNFGTGCACQQTGPCAPEGGGFFFRSGTCG